MKNNHLLSAAIVLAASFSASASFQHGTVTELSVSHDRATFQLDVSTGIDIRESCLDSSKPLNFIIDFTRPGGRAMFDTVVAARNAGTVLGVNGDGVCAGDEFEKADSIAPQ